MPKKITNEEYVERVRNINPNIKVLGEYINNRTKILHKCKIDGYEWYATPSSILSGYGCPKCGGNVKKTQDEYIQEVFSINPNIEVLGKYDGMNVKILHKCRIDGYEWYAYPNHILRGSGCPKCLGLRKTHEEYVEELSALNPNIEVIEKYINAHTKILHKCKIDNYVWKVSPHSLLMGNGCPMCYGNMKKTHEEYMDDLLKINPNIEVIGNYINCKTKILHRCKIDGYEWEACPSSLLSGVGCPICSGVKKRTHDEYVADVKTINQNIEVVEEFVNVNTKILHRCKIDGCEWYAIPNNILRGQGCPRCAGNERYGHEGYIKRITEINPNIEVLGVYVNAHTPILHRCNVDGYEWYALPNGILSGGGCPKCNESKGEKAITNWLNKNNILYESQKRFNCCKNIKPLPFDFYLPDYNICIEYQGMQHYEPVEHFGGREKFEGQILRDNIKKEYCKKNNIILFEIPYYSNLDIELLKLYELIVSQEKGVAV